MLKRINSILVKDLLGISCQSLQRDEEYFNTLVILSPDMIFNLGSGMSTAFVNILSPYLVALVGV